MWANFSSGARGAGRRLIDREEECEVLTRLLQAVRTGESRTIVVRGDPGVGKSALLEYLESRSSDCRVVEAAGVQSEMEIAFAGLHQLCSPMLGHLKAIPGPQGDALLITFGMTSGPVPDRFLVGLAVLSLLSEVAAERPLLCLIDDEQWLDQASAQILAFVARRLGSESICLAFGTRTPGSELAGLPELVVGGLSQKDAGALLDSALAVPVYAGVRDQIVAESGGNPLALLEFPRDLTAGELAGGFGLPRALSLSANIEERFRRRIEALPAMSRSLILVASAEPAGDSVLVWRAAARLGINPAAALPAAEAGLVKFDACVRFRHPLVRSAIYWSASALERQTAHRAWAEVIDPVVDPDRRAWHLAQAAEGPDEEAAGELERSAERAQARGGFAAAAAFLERAVVLTRDPTLRPERALRAAQAQVQVAAVNSALDLLAIAESGPLNEFQEARVDLVRAQLAFVANRGNDAAPLLVTAAGKLESIDRGLARATYLDAFVAAQFAGRFAGRGGTLLDVARAVASAPRPPNTPGGADLLLDGLVLYFNTGCATGFPILRRALKSMHELPVDEELRWLSMGYAAAVTMWDQDTTEMMSERWAKLAHDAGALSELPLALMSRVYCLITLGDLAAAASVVEEMTAAMDATASIFLPYGAMGLAACRGDEIESSVLIESTVKQAEQRGEGFGISAAQWANAVLHNGAGHYDEALIAAKLASENHYELGLSNWALIELVEAAVHVGQSVTAADALSRLRVMTSASGTDWALGVQARMNALLGEGDDADRLYRESISRLGRTRVRFELGRAHLSYGEWLRRNRRRREALEHLRTARDLFEDMGMEGFAERTRREIRAGGESARKRRVDTPGQLTAQEAQIARLARDGLSNPEIGIRLFISSRTVQYHLSKVFTKLGITSRAQLHRALV